jgi:AraC-like DNA-binding protein
MNICVNSSKPQEIVTKLASKLKIKKKSSGTENVVTIPKRLGEGSVKVTEFLDGLTLICFDVLLKEDLSIQMDEPEDRPIRFLFCVEGEITHVLDSDRLRYQLRSMMSAISHSYKSREQLFMIPLDERVRFHILQIDIKNFFPKIKQYINTLPEKLAELFKDDEKTSQFFYQSDYSLDIAESLSLIEKNEHEGLVRRIFLESKALDLLWMEIKQFKDDLNPYSKQNVLRKTDADLIIKAKNILIKYLRNPPDVKELAKMSGTNQNKLKSGFRRLFDKSIGEVLRDERLNQAKILLAEENLNVKEIAHQVGYSNKSAFAKRFKEKFGVVPSTFLKRYKAD